VGYYGFPPVAERCCRVFRHLLAHPGLTAEWTGPALEQKGRAPGWANGLELRRCPAKPCQLPPAASDGVPVLMIAVFRSAQVASFNLAHVCL